MSDCAILAIASTTETVRTLLTQLVHDSDVDAQDVPWTIVNKYYTAQVQFFVRPFSAWGSIQDEAQAPALLFVWKRGEPYRDQIRRLAQEAHAFEVALAVRLPGSNLVDEDDEEVDAYLSSEGFEFVDVRADDMACSLPRDRSGIPRIVDALSTIMWPSMCMIQQPSKGKGPDAVQKDNYDTLVRLVGERIGGDDDRMKRALEELERWLDETPSGGDDDNDDDDGIPWSTVVTPGTLSPCSTGFFDRSRPSTPTLKTGFDDDFTCFVSAPAESLAHFPPARASEGSGQSSPALGRTCMLGPGDTYRSLGSMSDLGLGDVDADMPSRADIAETSRRIFGDPLSRSPVQENGDGDLERFDLQSVLSALQGLKEEIAEMPDEKRKRAAARVALGLAYGLGGNDV